MSNNTDFWKDKVVLITGATGFTGKVLTKKLSSLGATVHAIARKSSRTTELDNLNIKWFRGNVYDPEIVKSATEGVHYIFHVAAAFREAKISNDEYRKVHVESTELLAKEALKQEQFKRFIHVSTMGVHGHIENPPGNENSPYSPGDEYQITKLEAELWIKDFATKNNLPFTIIRPTGIFGPGDKRLLKVFKMAKMKFFPILGSGECLYHLIHVEDLANAIILSATADDALGEEFLIGNTEAIKLEEIINLVAQKLKTNPKAIRMPAWPFFILGWICEVICKPFGIEPPIYRRRVAFFTKDRSYDTSKMQKRLGYMPQYSNKEGILNTLEWYIHSSWV